MKKYISTILLAISMVGFAQIKCTETNYLYDRNKDTKTDLKMLICFDSEAKYISLHNKKFKIINHDTSDKETLYLVAENENKDKILFGISNTDIIVYSRDLEVDWVLTMKAKK